MTKNLDASVHEFASRYWEALNTPVALACSLLAKYGEWGQLSEKKIDPRTYSRFLLHKFECDYLAVELLRKYPGLPLDVDRVAAAKQTFWLAEKACFKTNRRLFPYVDHLKNGFTAAEVNIDLTEFFRRVRKKVSEILGPLPEALVPKFGPGTTFELEKSDVSSNLVLGDKFERGIYCTSSMVDLLPFVYASAHGRALLKDVPHRSGYNLVRGNRFFTVPKSALTDRGCCSEPGANVSLQLPVGRYIRSRLKYAGINLKQGQQVHGELARLASSNGQRATIDLATASDTNSLVFTELCLPTAWFDLLSSLRSPYTRIDKKWVKLEKFSSMGNGFTFELETLLFYCVCSVAVGDSQDVKVYGDDIIVPTSKVRECIAALAFCGFTTNERKTFTTGSFRESCGTDAFDGHEVKPLRLDAEVLEPIDWIATHNGALRALGPVMSLRARLHCKMQVPSDIRRNSGPSDWSNVFHEPDKQYWSIKVRRGIRYVRAWVQVGRPVPLHHFKPGNVLAQGLYGVSSLGSVPRNAGSYCSKWVPYS